MRSSIDRFRPQTANGERQLPAAKVPAIFKGLFVQYMLVIQWSSEVFADFDSMIGTEEALREGLSKSHDVDGHDWGAGQANIFIETGAPQSAFSEIKPILQSQGKWDGVRIAFRPSYGDGYSILWPESLREFVVK